MLVLCGRSLNRDGAPHPSEVARILCDLETAAMQLRDTQPVRLLVCPTASGPFKCFVRLAGDRNARGARYLCPSATGGGWTLTAALGVPDDTIPPEAAAAMELAQDDSGGVRLNFPAAAPLDALNDAQSTSALAPSGVGFSWAVYKGKSEGAFVLRSGRDDKFCVSDGGVLYDQFCLVDASGIPLASTDAATIAARATEIIAGSVPPSGTLCALRSPAASSSSSMLRQLFNTWAEAERDAATGELPMTRFFREGCATLAQMAVAAVCSRRAPHTTAGRRQVAWFTTIDEGYGRLLSSLDGRPTTRALHDFASNVQILESEIARVDIMCTFGQRKQGKSTVLSGLFNVPLPTTCPLLNSTEPLVVAVRHSETNHARQAEGQQEAVAAQHGLVIDLPAANDDHLQRLILGSAAVVLVVQECRVPSVEAFPTRALSHASPSAEIFVIMTKADHTFLDAAEEALTHGFPVALHSSITDGRVAGFTFRWRDATYSVNTERADRNGAALLQVLRQVKIYVPREGSPAYYVDTRGARVTVTRGGLTETEVTACGFIRVVEGEQAPDPARSGSPMVLNVDLASQCRTRTVDDNNKTLALGLRRSLEHTLKCVREPQKAPVVGCLDEFTARCVWEEALRRVRDVHLAIRAAPALRTVPDIHFQLLVPESEAAPPGSYIEWVEEDVHRHIDARRVSEQLPPAFADPVTGRIRRSMSKRPELFELFAQYSGEWLLSHDDLRVWLSLSINDASGAIANLLDEQH
jgi:hypothetical protein